MRAPRLLRRWRESVVHDGLRLLQDTVQMIRPREALRINLVNVFRAGRTRRKPSTRGNDLQAANGRTIAGGLATYAQYLFAGQFVA